MVIKPKLLWKFEKNFLVKEGEPSKLYMIITRVCGVFLVICSALLLFYSLSNKTMG